MRWWDRFIAWGVAVSEARVVGRGATSANVLSEGDRAWLREAAGVLERATRVEVPEATVVITLSDEVARLISARLRGIAG